MGLKKIVFFWLVGFLCCKAKESSTQKDYFKSYDEKVIGSIYFFNTSNPLGEIIFYHIES